MHSHCLTPLGVIPPTVQVLQYCSYSAMCTIEILPELYVRLHLGPAWFCLLTGLGIIKGEVLGDWQLHILCLVLFQSAPRNHYQHLLQLLRQGKQTLLHEGAVLHLREDERNTSAGSEVRILHLILLDGQTQGHGTVILHSELWEKLPPLL